jgi:hypothetical protein
MDSRGHLYSVSDLKEMDLEVEDPYPKHSEKPESFVLSVNGERYRNTRLQRRKARKAQKTSRKRNR